MEQTLLSKIQSFDPNGPKAPAEFRDLVKSADSKEVKSLGDTFVAWQVGCLYHFLLSPHHSSGLKQSATQLIQQYKALEYKAVQKQDNELLKYLRCECCEVK